MLKENEEFIMDERKVFYISIKSDPDLTGNKMNFIVINHKTISITLPWFKSVTFIEPYTPK